MINIENSTDLDAKLLMWNTRLPRRQLYTRATSNNRSRSVSKLGGV